MPEIAEVFVAENNNLLDTRFDSLNREISRITTVRANVPYFGSYWKAYKQLLAIDEDVANSTRSLIEELSLVDATDKPDQAFNDAYAIQKSMQAEEAKIASDYPDGYENLKGWYPAFNRLGYDKEYLERVKLNFRLPIASTVPDRMALFRFIASTTGKNENLRLIDYGSSLQFGLGKWAMVDIGINGLSYENFQIMYPEGGTLAVDETDSDLFNGYVKANLLPSMGLSVDIFNARNDREFREWAISNSRRPADYKNPAYHQQFTTLIDYNNYPDCLKFLGECYDQPFNISEVRSIAGDEPFDVVMASNTLYQNNEDGINTAVENAELLLANDGLIIIFESRKFTSKIKDRYGKPLFPEATDSHGTYDYSVFVKNMRRPGAGFLQCILVDDPRPKRIIILPPLVDLILL